MTKRIVSILVAVFMVMALIPMTALAKDSASRSGDVQKLNEVRSAARPSKTAAVTFDFEYSSEAEFDWTLIDSDGDGYEWYWLGYGINQSTANMAYEGVGNLTSASYQGGVVLYPDNWAITPAVAIPDDATTLTFWVKGQDPSYADEHYAVYVGTAPTVSSMTQILPESVATGDWVQKTIDISGYAGDTMYFGFRHFNVADMFRINLDLVEIHSEGEPVDPTPVPTATPAPGGEYPTPGAGEAVVVLEAEDVWGDGTGYQMLLDADANTYGSIIPTSGGLTTSGNASAATYAEFEYKIPENADGNLNTSNMILDSMGYVVIPAGTYDWCITNPTPGDRMWIASSYGSIPGRYDNYVFQEGAVYVFHVSYGGQNDQVDLTIIGDVDPQPTPEPPAPDPLLSEALNVEGGEIEFASVGDYPWHTVTAGGRFYATSTNAGNASTTSVLTATVVANAGDIVQFDFKAWGEGSYSTWWDECAFYVDNTMVASWGAYDNDWETFSYGLTAGTHNLKWSYTKDSSVNPDGDYFAVDNVYVGAPVHVEQIVATESITVPVNRTGMIEWTVLPDAAFNKEVTLTVDDPTIATVNDKGQVFGVSEGETFVTIASVEDPSIYAVCEIEVVDMGFELVTFYGLSVYDPSEEHQDMWVTFNDGEPGNLTDVAYGPSTESYCGAYAYGKVYMVNLGYELVVASINDLGNFQTIATGVAEGYYLISLTWNYADGLLYGIAIDEEDSSFNLVGVDPASGDWAIIMPLNIEALALASDENGLLYVVDFGSDLYTINLANNSVNHVGYTGVESSYVQGFCYDFDSSTLYWAHYLEEGVLCRVDKATAAVEEIGLLGSEGNEIVAMFTIPSDEPAPVTGNVPVTGITITPEEVEVREGATIQFTAHITPFNASNKNIEWGVDDESVIAVDQNGMVIALKEGTAMVYATTEDGNYTAYAIVNVLAMPGGMVAGYYFEVDPISEGWRFVDYDGDGYNWEWNYGGAANGVNVFEGEGIIQSNSYVNYVGALYPDNWAITPALNLPDGNATVTLYAAGQDPDWASEHFAIFAGLTNNPADMIQVSAEFVATGDYVEYSADLSMFAGETCYIAIRHFNVTDEFILNVDQVEIWGEEEQPPTEHLWGDANGDGKVDSSDVLLTMRYVMGLAEIAPEDLPWVDVNGDGVVDMTDALLIARVVMGLMDHFIVEE